jgi:hypothetical protein
MRDLKEKKNDFLCFFSPYFLATSSLAELQTIKPKLTVMSFLYEVTVTVLPLALLSNKIGQRCHKHRSALAAGISDKLFITVALQPYKLIICCSRAAVSFDCPAKDNV